MSGRMYEEWAIVATVDPIDSNNVDGSSDIIDMRDFHEILVIVMLGVLNDAATNTVALYEDEASNMAGEAAITGKSQAIVGTDDAKQFLIALDASELSAGCRYVRVKQDNSAHSQLLAILVLGRPRFKPATDVDLSSVQTVVD